MQMEPYYLVYDKRTDELKVSEYRLSSGSNAPCKTIFTSENETGWKNYPEFEIADSGFKIIIQTNFGFNSKSYFHAQIVYNGIQLLDFPGVNNMYSLDQLTLFREKPDYTNWPNLLNKIAEAYKQRDYWNLHQFTNAIIALDEAASKFISSEDKKDIKEIRELGSLFKNLWLALSGGMQLKIATLPMNLSLINTTCSTMLTLAKVLYDNIPKSNNIISWTNNGVDTIYDFLKLTNQREIILS